MSKVFAGIDNLESVQGLLKGRRLGLITGPTGVNSRLVSTVDVLRERFNLVRLFAPEHGIRGERQAGDDVATYVDEDTGLEVVSLYNHGEGAEASMEGLDAVVFDIQDVGARFYTYLFTMTEAMQRCAGLGIPLIVLDRMNPLGLTQVEGCLLEEEFSSFVGRYGIPTRYGLTMGEFAGYVNAHAGMGAELYVAPCLGLNRGMWWEDGGGAWIAPSPNIPTADTALCFVGTCLFEGTNVSEGRGTTKPFETVGAPWMKPRRVVEIMRGHNLPGVDFRQCYFTPSFSKYRGEMCAGVQIHIRDKYALRSFETGLLLLQAIRNTHGEFAFRQPQPNTGRYFIDLLLGSSALRRPGFDPREFVARQQKACEGFSEANREYWLY